MDMAITTEPDYQAILDRVRAGELTGNIASQIGIGKGALRYRLSKLPDYNAAIAEQAEALVESAVAEMFDPDLAADTSIIARARARVDTAFKWAAARDPSKWAPRSQVTNVNIDAGDLGERLRRARSRAGRVIDQDQPADATLLADGT
jgi:hypothetical protein